MFGKKMKASDLVAGFQQMLHEGWQYVPNAAREGEVDCSGAFVYWYNQSKVSVPHGSNSMYRTHSTEKGKIMDLDLVPGMAVYRWRDDGNEPEKFRSDGLGNFRHVGLYVGNGKCIEAKDSKNGVVQSDISTWQYASKLKNTVYDLKDEVSSGSATAPMEGAVSGTVSLSSGTLNLRSKPSTSSSVLASIPNGARVEILQEGNDWHQVAYAKRTGWVSAKYIQIDRLSNASGLDGDPASEKDYFRRVIVDVRSERVYSQLLDFLWNSNTTYLVENGDD